MAKDAVALIKADHRKVEQLFRELEEAGDRAYKTKQQLVEQVIKELEVHATIEEETYYPAVNVGYSGTAMIRGSRIGGMDNDNVRGMPTFQTMYVTQ